MSAISDMEYIIIIIITFRSNAAYIYPCKELHSYLKYSARNPTSHNTTRCHVITILLTLATNLTFDLGSTVTRKLLFISYFTCVKHFHNFNISGFLFICELICTNLQKEIMRKTRTHYQNTLVFIAFWQYFFYNHPCLYSCLIKIQYIVCLYINYPPWLTYVVLVVCVQQL